MCVGGRNVRVGGAGHGDRCGGSPGAMWRMWVAEKTRVVTGVTPRLIETGVYIFHLGDRISFLPVGETDTTATLGCVMGLGLVC